MKKILGLVLTFTALSAFPMHWFNSSGASLGHFSEGKCASGVTCTAVGGRLNMVADPSALTGNLTLQNSEVISNSTDDTIELSSDDNDLIVAIKAFEAKDAKLVLKADESDDNGDDWELKAAASGNAFTLSNDTSGSQVAKLTVSTAGDITAVGSITGDGGDSVSGFLQKRVLATATTITAAQCGSTFYNGGAVQMELPEASTVLGCRLTFITANASNFDVNPDNADQILVLTNAAGDAIRNATLGNSVTIEAISASEWAQIAAIGTWTDIN